MKRGFSIILLAIPIILLVLISSLIFKQGTKQEKTCEEFCKEQPHVACVGSWKISGKYPECSCEFVCGADTVITTEKLSLDASIEKNCVGFLIGSAGEEILAVKEAGAAWIRPHPGPFSWGFIEEEKGKFDFQDTDKYAKEAGKQGIAILITIWPFADWDQTCKTGCDVGRDGIFAPMTKFGMKEGIPSKRCRPCSMEDYKNFLKKLVERYDGDGVDDMYGLELPIKYWEISNEPEMQEGFLTFFKGTEADYVEILNASYEAIKEVCQDCKVVQGGAAGIDTNMIGFWNNVFTLNGGDYFDIANIHYVNSGDLNTLNVKRFRELMQQHNINKPIWVTEAEYAENVKEIRSSVSGALLAGAERIFFTRLIIGDKKSAEKGSYKQQYEGITDLCSP